MCAPLAQTRDEGRITAPDENGLEASPGIEPGCKDLQSRPRAFFNPLISGICPRNRGKTLENQRQVQAGLGVSRHCAAMIGDETLTNR